MSRTADHKRQVLLCGRARRCIHPLRCPEPTLADAEHAAGSVRVAFLQGEQLSVVARPGATPTQAVRALLAGPTAAERRRGFRTYLAAGTKLHRLGVSGSLATVDLGTARLGGERPTTGLRVSLNSCARSPASTGFSASRFWSTEPRRSAWSRACPSRSRSPFGFSKHRTSRCPSRRSPGCRAGRRHEDPPGAADRPRLPAAGRRRRPVRPGDVGRAADVPEVGAARSHRHARCDNNGAARDGHPPSAGLNRGARQAGGDLCSTDRSRS